MCPVCGNDGVDKLCAVCACVIAGLSCVIQAVLGSEDYSYCCSNGMLSRVSLAVHYKYPSGTPKSLFYNTE